MELGSEFNLRPEKLAEVQNSIFHMLSNYCTYYVDSGRSALRLLLKEINQGEVLLPEYLCASVLQPFSEFKIIYYKLKEDLTIDLTDLRSRINSNTRVVYLMHYFGALQPQETLTQISLLKNAHDFMIIEDTTHSLFSQPQTIGDYCVCSLRKWFAIPDGGVLYAMQPLKLSNPDDLPRNTKIDKVYGMILKTLYLDGIIESNSLYRQIFTDAEKSIEEKEKSERISEFSEYLLKCVDPAHLIARRKENYSYLRNKIVQMGFKPIVNIEEGCPFALPITIETRDALREYLIEKKVYCAVHWPLHSTPLAENERARDISAKILSLPIDQRYGAKEMAYLARVLKNYKGSSECR